MEKSEFAQIVRRLRANANWKDFCEECYQADEIYERLKGYDFKDVDEATTHIIINDYFPPVVARFEAVLKSTRKMREEKEEKLKKEKEPLSTKEDFDRQKKWIRFSQWCIEEKVFPKSFDEAEEMKAEFEKKYPNWQPRSRKQEKTKEPKKIGNILEDVFGDLMKGG